MSTGDTEGRTICIAGPPGMGKTAFLSEFARRAAKGKGHGAEMLCVDPVPAELHSTAQLLGALGLALPDIDPDAGRRLVERMVRQGALAADGDGGK